MNKNEYKFQMMKKRIKLVGGESLGVRFTKDECELYDLKKGDWVDLGDLVKIEDE